VPETTSAPAGPRLLLPREHGAWGQLALPLLAGLLLGRPGAAALLLAAAVVLTFAAHEPLRVVLGQRGRRLRDGEGARARRWLAAEGGLAATAGAVGITLSPPAALAALGLSAVLAAGVGVLVWRRREKTAAGEILVAAALATAGGAVALAAGVPLAPALAATLAWILSFSAATLGVRAVLVRLRTRGAQDPGRRSAALSLCAEALAVALVAAGLPAALAWATLPGVAAGVVIALLPVAGRHLRAVGWSIVGASVVTLGVLLGGL
jgi:hypothetical protein